MVARERKWRLLEKSIREFVRIRFGNVFFKGFCQETPDAGNYRLLLRQVFSWFHENPKVRGKLSQGSGDHQICSSKKCREADHTFRMLLDPGFFIENWFR